MRRRKLSAYLLVGVVAVCAVGAGRSFQLGYPAAAVLAAAVAVVVLLIAEHAATQNQNNATNSATTGGSDGAVLLFMTTFLGIGVLSILATAVFRFLEGAMLKGASWLALDLVFAVAGIWFLRDHWPS
ncbi:hypothetical protein GMA12_16895 [Kocuria sediminis]|uniref:Uncharacterized protein n=1 Tax=Kocuria sediminis TaxID=1038857 RepID=A0A6N8GNT9_9MICC|nr:hypothetical protein [Kocuria sediminis]MUN64796.1 hypothetical protein [Kocuria sediminis]